MLRVWILLGLLGAGALGDATELFKGGFASITEDELLADLTALAGPDSEGRDSPSVGLDQAADYIAARLSAAGFVGAGKDASFRMPFSRTLPAPDEASCAFSVDRLARARPTRGINPAPPPGEVIFELGVDYVPVWRTEGRARGEVVLLGFGIDSDGERFDEITGDLSGKIALIVSGEPRHKRKFEGPEVSAAAELYGKLASLREAGVAGALVVRRPPPEPKKKSKSKAAKSAHDEPDGQGGEGTEGVPEPEPERFGFRHTWASWNDGHPPVNPPIDNIPTLEITREVAHDIAGVDVIERLAVVDSKGKPLKPELTGVTAEIAAATSERTLQIDNVVGVLKGSDPILADEYVVIGAHYDHVGVDSRGRIGFGADDNASGTAAMLEIAEALAAARPRRSILACAFAAEEDGLLGSEHFVQNASVPAAQMIAMINLDMVGYGDPSEVAVIGVPENPGFEKLLSRANKLQRTEIRKITTGQGHEIFKRSDHYPFHRQGVPVLFFFEGLPIGANPHYHTWRDTIEELDVEKIARTTRLVFNTAWLLSEDDERPPPPKHTR